MKAIYSILVILITILLISCGNKRGDTQSNLLNSTDDSKQFALTLYGDEVKVLAKGDLLANGKLSAIAAIVRNQTDNSIWIQKGSFIQKENDGWKVILKMEEKLYSTTGELTSQIEAKNGYIINFDSTKRPISINIVMANEYGKGASDDAILKWDNKKNEFLFLAPYEDIP